MATVDVDSSTTFFWPVFGSISTFFFVTSCSTMLNSTRRFFSLPSSVDSSAMRRVSP
ncbi:hypothetical protein OV079_12925 [Nannocystis pusilla]|uniref:Uncharacterized protein n=1 Tax=Nannocystis pusilla TaxID=889268 RepID=A0A9X3IWH6_9BACT|nr:hypothetical protein [Nannocystis pusilla]MCY1006446.1 hypothetical protein [Nannocystis pusilla]